jgi:hypothetical protein
MATVHLHRDDVPDTLALLHALLGHRTHPTPGYTPDETGADVDWDLLGDGYGCAILERHGGGLAVELRWQVRAAVASTTE